jgi:hypothetical protein
LWLLSALLCVLGATFALGLRMSQPDSALRLRDRAFAERANARCARAEREVVSPNRRPDNGTDEVGRIQALASGWAEMVLDLRRFEVAPTDRAKVDSWLAAWDRWTSLGYDYADALESGDEAGAQEVIVRSEVPKQVIGAFATVNDMPDCVFR